MNRLFVFALTVVFFASTRVSAQVPLLSGLGGHLGYGESCLGPNDDGSSRAVDISSVFPAGLRFFDQTHRSMFVNTNGNISFGAALGTYTPQAFPVANQPMIAPFWADADIRFDSTDCENTDGQFGMADAPCHDPDRNGVWWDVDSAARRVVVTWHEVGYFDCKKDKVMNFQLVLTPAPATACSSNGDFDVEFRFNRCEWNTGDQSGGQNGLAPGVVDGQRTAACMSFPVVGEICPGPGRCVGGTCTFAATPAQSGFDAGNSTDWVEIPGSRTNEIHQILCTNSNVGEPGIWRFSIRSGEVLCPDAGDPCSEGGVGVCGIGRTACVRGTTECRHDLEATPERCDALDNDCDGQVDEADGICDPHEVCSRGACIGTCFEGGCADGLTCTEAGRCVETACQDVSCPEGQRCRLGACVDACDGVVCPGDLTCVSGQCVDTCAGTTCDDCTVCSAGACIARCAPGVCGEGEECTAEGRCVDRGCAALTCSPGEVCRTGACVDACEGAVCPMGETCVAGNCVDGNTPPMGSDGSLPDGSVPTDAEEPSRDRPRTCGCRVVGTDSEPSLALFAFAAIALLVRHRTSRRRSRR